jgi:hypothetical protein
MILEIDRHWRPSPVIGLSRTGRTRTDPLRTAAILMAWSAGRNPTSARKGCRQRLNIDLTDCAGVFT